MLRKQSQSLNPLLPGGVKKFGDAGRTRMSQKFYKCGYMRWYNYQKLVGFQKPLSFSS